VIIAVQGLLIFIESEENVSFTFDFFFGGNSKNERSE